MTAVQKEVKARRTISQHLDKVKLHVGRVDEGGCSSRSVTDADRKEKLVLTVGQDGLQCRTNEKL